MNNKTPDALAATDAGITIEEAFIGCVQRQMEWNKQMIGSVERIVKVLESLERRTSTKEPPL